MTMQERDFDGLPDEFMPPDGLVPPDLQEFDKEGTLHNSLMNAADNAPNSMAFSSLMASLFRPQLDTELEPFKFSNLTKPKQRRALDIALELFEWEYTSLACNRYGAMALVSSQAEAIRENAKGKDAAFERADELAEDVARLNSLIGHLSNLPKSGNMIGFPTLDEQMKTWHQYQVEINQCNFNIAQLPQEARSYFYMRKCWLDLQQSLAQTASSGARVVDYTEVRERWRSRKFEPGELLSRMPWSYNLAYKMHIGSLSDGTTWRNFVVSVFTQSPFSSSGRQNRRMGSGFPSRRSRRAGPDDPDY